MASETEIVVRRLRLEFPADFDPLLVADAPEESFINVGLSLLLPYLEPYLIRSINQAKPQVTDPALLEDIAAFNAQEGQHYRQHIRFNEALHLKGYERLKDLEAELDADYRRFTDTRSLRFNLAYAEGFEAYTTAIALYALETGLTERLHPSVRDLFAWHLTEELEHRTVAFDVYEHVCGGYFYRMIVGLFAQWHLNRFVVRVAATLKAADPVSFKARFGGGWAAWKRARPLLWQVLLRLIPKVFATSLPWYSPHKIALPEAAITLARRYGELSEEQARAS